MVELHSIESFFRLPPQLQQEVQKSLRMKDRLEGWLTAQNKKAGQSVKPHHEGRWIPCAHCLEGQPGICHCTKNGHPGWHWMAPSRDDSDIHPSAINKCLKFIWLSCSGYSAGMEEVIEPRIRMLFDLGTSWHIVMQDFYGKRGAWGDPKNYHPEVSIDPDAVDANGNPLQPLAERYWIRGHVDALINNYLIAVPGLGECSVKVVHEYKTINSNGYTKLTRPKPEHKKQATIYSAVLDAPFVVYFYTNKDNSQIIDFPVAFDSSIWNEVTQRIDRVLELVEAKRPPAWEETSHVLNPRECMECPYQRVCDPPARR